MFIVFTGTFPRAPLFNLTVAGLLTRSSTVTAGPPAFSRLAPPLLSVGMKAEGILRNGSDRRPLKELTAAGTVPGSHRLPFSNECDAAALAFSQLRRFCQQALAAPIHRNPLQKYEEAKKIANQTLNSCSFQNYCYLCSPQTTMVRWPSG